MIQKEQLFAACKVYLDLRKNRLQKAISDLENDLAQETKSSAGDKYETSREMITAEINKLSVQLQQFRQLEEVLNAAQKRKTTPQIQLGSYVETSHQNYLLAIPAGELLYEAEKVYAIGLNSPMAQILKGKAAGQEFEFNGKQHTITAVL